MTRMKKYLWKNLIVFLSIISTLLLQGFSCYAASSEADTSGDYVSEFSLHSSYSSDNSDRDIVSDLEYTEGTDVVNADTESAETEDVNTEAEDSDTEDAITEAEDSDIEDAITETESVKTEGAETESVTVKEDEDNVDTLNSSSTEASVNGKNTVSPVVNGEETVALDQPVISEYGVQPFDFIMDPQRLITETNGVKYGNISFEEGSTLYFRNLEGSYDYSSRSDQLTITNRSTVPVMITLTASLQNYDRISLTNDPAFKGDYRDSLYLALVDDKGNVIPLSESGEVKIIYELGEISEEEAIEEAEAKQYSFGLTGACNPKGSWDDCDELPQVVVTWKVDPVLTSENAVSDNSISDNSISMNSVSDNSISMNSVSDNSISMNSVSDNSISMNSVSDNSISMNGVSDNSISMNSVSDNSISMNGALNDISANGVSENGGVVSAEVQDVANDSEETGADTLEAVDEVSDQMISDNIVSDHNIETETAATPAEGNSASANADDTEAENGTAHAIDNDSNSNMDALEKESTLPKDSSVITDIEDTKTDTASAEDSSNTDAAKTVVATGGNGSGDDAGTTAGSNMVSQTTMETVSGLSDGSASVQTGITNVEVESGTYF